MKRRVSRSLHLVTAEGAQTRKETYLGREYLVMPVVALVEGVIWPVNAETPEFVPEESYSLAPESWSGRPVFPAHPVRGGTQVLGNTPEIMEAECVGIVFNSGVTKHKLAMEAWINRDDCERVGEHALDTYERAENGDPIEISVGATVLMEEVEGEYKGKKYNGRWVEVIPDHLALLPEGDLGACSIEMGCGVRAAMAHRICASGYELTAAKEGTLPAPKKDKKTPVRQSLVAMLSGLLRTASPSGWSDTEVRAELLEALIAVEPDLKYNGYPLDVYDNEGIVVYYLYDQNYECKLYARSYKWEGDKAVVDSKRVSVEATTVYVPTDSNESLAVAMVAAAKLKTVPVAAVAAPPCGCGKNRTASEGEDPMKTRAQVVAAMIAAKGSKFKESDKTWLEAMPDEHFKKLVAASEKDDEDEDEDEEDKDEDAEEKDEDDTDDEESKEVRQTKGAKAAKSKKVKAKKAAKRKDDDDEADDEEVDEVDEESRFLDRHPEIRSLVERQRATDAAERTSLTARILGASKEYTKKELAAMQFGQLQRLARAMGVHQTARPSDDTRTDFSGLPAYRELGSGDENDGVPEPPSLNERVRAASGKSTH